MPAKKNKVPAADFVAAARREFGYLISEFGYEEDLKREKIMSPRCVCYAGPIQLVTVEGMPTTSTVQVNVTVMMGDGGDPVRLALPAIVEMRAPGVRMVMADMLAQLARDAELLRIHAADVLRADASAKASAQKLAEEIEHAMTLEKKHQQTQVQSSGIP